MERLILNQLLNWKNSPYRKPLILKGVRQVGKTWILKEFGRRYYENTAYFNFDENEEYKQFFEITKDGITDKFELPQGIVFRNIKGYMEQYRKNWEMLCELKKLRKEV